VSYNDSGAGGHFATDPATTTAKGVAGSHYTAPTTAGPVTVTATVGSVGSALLTINVN